jgi:hypothetical protein
MMIGVEDFGRETLSTIIFGHIMISLVRTTTHYCLKNSNIGIARLHNTKHKYYIK